MSDQPSNPNEFFLIAAYIPLRNESPATLVVFNSLKKRLEKPAFKKLLSPDDSDQLSENFYSISFPKDKRQRIPIVHDKDMSYLNPNLTVAETFTPAQDYLGVITYQDFEFRMQRSGLIEVFFNSSLILTCSVLIKSKVGSTWFNFSELYRIKEGLFLFIDQENNLRAIQIKDLVFPIDKLVIAKIDSKVSSLCFHSHSSTYYYVKENGEIFSSRHGKIGASQTIPPPPVRKGGIFGMLKNLIASKPPPPDTVYFNTVAAYGKFLVVGSTNEDRGSNCFELFNSKTQKFLDKITMAWQGNTEKSNELKSFELFFHQGTILGISLAIRNFMNIFAVRKSRLIHLVKNFRTSEKPGSGTTHNCLTLRKLKNRTMVVICGFPFLLKELKL